MERHCWFCGKSDDLVYAGFEAWLGGTGDVPQYKCRDEAACQERQRQATKEWNQALAIKEG